MNLDEYQVKNIFLEYGLSVPKSILVENSDQALSAIKNIGGEKWVFKAQIHAGGNGVIGAVKVISNIKDIERFVRNIIGTKLITQKKGLSGNIIDSVLIEEYLEIEKEIYFAMFSNQKNYCITCITSNLLGIDIEDIISNSFNMVSKENFFLPHGAQDYQARKIGFKLGFSGVEINQFTKIFLSLFKLFRDKDFQLLEISPLVVTKNRTIYCLDAKVLLDKNAMYRQQQLLIMQDFPQDASENSFVREKGPSYFSLKESIVCMVNGYGLALSMMDTMQAFGVSSINLLDFGGDITEKKIIDAFKRIVLDKKVKVIFVNIFGGIVNCNTVAAGIIQAFNEINIKLPIVVRLLGTNSNLAVKNLKKSNLKIFISNNLTSSIEKTISIMRDENESVD